MDGRSISESGHFRQPAPTYHDLKHKVAARFIICIVLSFTALVALYGANGLFFHTRLRDFKWVEILKNDMIYFAEVRDLMHYIEHPNPLIRNSRVSLNPSPQPKPNPPSELQMNIERASKDVEVTFVSICIVGLLVGQLVFLCPFFFRLRVKFRSWYLYLSLAYFTLVGICIIGGGEEINSVFFTDRAYTEMENLAVQNNSIGALMLASCQLRKNEFQEEIRKRGNAQYLKYRDENYVCQDSWWKIGAGILCVGAGVLYFAVGFVLAYHFAYIRANKIYPVSQLEAQAEQVRQEQLVSQIWMNIKSAEEQEQKARDAALKALKEAGEKPAETLQLTPKKKK